MLFFWIFSFLSQTTLGRGRLRLLVPLSPLLLRERLPSRPDQLHDRLGRLGVRLLLDRRPLSRDKEVVARRRALGLLRLGLLLAIARLGGRREACRRSSARIPLGALLLSKSLPEPSQLSDHHLGLQLLVLVEHGLHVLLDGGALVAGEEDVASVSTLGLVRLLQLAHGISRLEAELLGEDRNTLLNGHRHFVCCLLGWLFGNTDIMQKSISIFFCSFFLREKTKKSWNFFVFFSVFSLPKTAFELRPLRLILPVHLLRLTELLPLSTDLLHDLLRRHLRVRLGNLASGIGDKQVVTRRRALGLVRLSGGLRAGDRASWAQSPRRKRPQQPPSWGDRASWVPPRS